MSVPVPNVEPLGIACMVRSFAPSVETWSLFATLVVSNVVHVHTRSGFVPTMKISEVRLQLGLGPLGLGPLGLGVSVERLPMTP